MKKQVRFSLEKGDLLPTLLMLPALFMIVFVMIVPLIYGLSLSFFEVGFGETNFKENFVGASNYLRFFRTRRRKRLFLIRSSSRWEPRRGICFSAPWGRRCC